jgi:diketogulonate reductase-like aldo/keto reductase
MPFVSLGTGSGQKGNVSSSIATWIQVGGVGIDTALIYGDQPKVALGLHAAGVSPSQVFITTKVPCNTYEQAAQAIEENLKQLKVDVVDLSLIHAFPSPAAMCAHFPGASIAQTWRALEDAKAAGKTRAIGVSSFKKKDLLKLQETARQRPSVNQDSLSVGHHDDDTMDFCDAHGITYMAYSPLCGGFNGSSCQHGNVMTLPEVKSMAKVHGVSPAQIALKWIVQQGRPLACASWKKEYMQEDLDLWSFNLTESEMKTLTAVKPSMSNRGEIVV